MVENKDKIAEAVGGLIGEVIGFVFCLAMLAGAYVIGSALAAYFVGAAHREACGILAAMTLIWTYEHRRADERWDRFLSRR